VPELLPPAIASDADEDVITGGGMQGRGLLTRGQRGAVVDVDLAGRLSPGLRPPRRERRGAGLAIRSFDHDRGTGNEGCSTPVHRRGARSRTRPVWSGGAGPSGSPGLGREHLPQVRRSVYDQRRLHWSLGIGFVVGLAAHVGGYLLKASVTTEPLGLVADLLYALGFALWTGVVMVVFVQVIPEVKRRQLKQMLDAYEATRREKARAGGDQASGDDQAPRAR